MKSIWEKNISPDEILNSVWNAIEAAVMDRKHSFHTPVFGTVGRGGRPCLRTVVLRRFDREIRRLVFHTHAGSPKIAEIEANRNVSWLFYDPAAKLQVRIEARGSIHFDDILADDQWNATTLFSRRCYTGAAPSMNSDKPTNGLPDLLNDREPTIEESEAGRANFAVIASIIDTIDCLELDFMGNRRSFFEFRENGEYKMSWKTP